MILSSPTQPVFAKDDTSSLIGQVAEIVVRIRSELDAKEEGLKLRQLEGTAKEYLWQMQEDKRKPHDDEKQFVRDMVHATFKVGMYVVFRLTGAGCQWLLGGPNQGNS